jgi:hypothetical protein
MQNFWDGVLVGEDGPGNNQHKGAGGIRISSDTYLGLSRINVISPLFEN